MKLRVEFDSKGNFRIAAEMRKATIQSEWVSYQNIANLKIQNSHYIAVSPYFEGNNSLKPNTIYQVYEVKE